MSYCCHALFVNSLVGRSQYGLYYFVKIVVVVVAAVVVQVVTDILKCCYNFIQLRMRRSYSHNTMVQVCLDCCYCSCFCCCCICCVECACHLTMCVVTSPAVLLIC